MSLMVAGWNSGLIIGPALGGMHLTDTLLSGHPY